MAIEVLESFTDVLVLTANLTSLNFLSLNIDENPFLKASMAIYLLWILLAFLNPLLIENQVRVEEANLKRHVGTGTARLPFARSNQRKFLLVQQVCHRPR